MPRNSAFKKASKALAKTRDFFSYESPYLTAVPGSEACYGPCCAGPGTVKLTTTLSMASTTARVNSSADAGQEPDIPLPEGTTEADESGADESESCDHGDEDGNEHGIPGWAEETKGKAHDPPQVEEDTLETKSVALGLGIKELEERILAVKDLRDVLRWACEQVINVTIPLGEPALQQLLMTLSKSARVGRNERLNKSKKDRVVEQDAVKKVDATNEKIKCEGSQVMSLHNNTSTTIAEKQEQSGIQHTRHSQEEYLQKLWSRSLLFTDIPPNFTEIEVSNLFAKYGKVEDCQIKFDTHTRASCAFGYVRMAEAHQADAAESALRGMVINGCKIHVQKPSFELYQATARKNGEATKTILDTVDNPKGFRLFNHLDTGLQSNTNPMLDHSTTQKALGVVATEPTAIPGISREELDISIEDLPETVVLKVQKFLDKHNCRMFGRPSSVHASSTASVPGQSQASPADAPLSTRSKDNSKLGGMIKHDHDRAGSQRRELAVTKWDVLRGLKLAAEEFLQVGAVMADDQFERFVHSSVMNAPNMPTGAYTVLRNDLLAENIGRLMGQVRERDSNGGVSPRPRHQDPTTRRWKTLKRDFPDVPAMISNLRLPREEIQAWIASGRHMSSPCLYIVAADEKSRSAVAEAVGEKDLHSPDDLAAFTRRLAEIDRDARFQLQKPDPAHIDPRDTHCKKLLELCTKTIGRYPGLRRLISLETDLPYHPSHERHCNDD